MRRTLQSFYLGLLQKHGWHHIEPLLGVLPEFETEVRKRQLDIFTSHEILRVAPPASRSEQFKNDQIWIAPDRAGFARLLYHSKSDPAKPGVADFLEKGGDPVPYEKLLFAVIPLLEKLMQVSRD